MSDRSTLPPPPPIIRVDQVFKQYRHYTRNLSLRQEAVELAKGFMRAYGKRTPPEPFYALRDVSFSIQRGESVGLIGRNGAGKTTLLRLLSHITRPTSGTVQVNGQFASLIGLGAGFSPDMTGRQNIYLNAAFLAGSLPAPAKSKPM
ncbi:MAG: ATP-binding cassette domain-containing protein [Anaerolineae bacterium]